jgi:PAS domain S-box-containing protein
MTSTFDNAGKGTDVFNTGQGSANIAVPDPSYIRIARILEQSVNEIYLFDAETLLFEYVNEGARRNLGYDMETLRRMTALDIKPEFDEASFRAMLQPLLSGEKEILTFETTHVRADATLYPVEVRLQLNVQPDKREFLAIVLDITSRRTAQLALQESEKRFRTMINTIPQLAWTAHPDGTRDWFNQRWYDYTGTTQQEMKNKGWESFHDPAKGHRALDSGNCGRQAFRYGISSAGKRWSISRIPYASGATEKFVGRGRAMVRHQHRCP